MPRVAKIQENWRQIALHIPPHLYEALRALCFVKRVYQYEIVIAALEAYLKEEKAA